MWGIEITFECPIAFYFHFWDHDQKYCVYTMDRQYLAHILQD